MGRVSRFWRWVTAGVLCTAVAVAAELPLAPAPRAVVTEPEVAPPPVEVAERAPEVAPAPRAADDMAREVAEVAPAPRAVAGPPEPALAPAAAAFPVAPPALPSLVPPPASGPVAAPAPQPPILPVVAADPMAAPAGAAQPPAKLPDVAPAAPRDTTQGPLDRLLEPMTPRPAVLPGPDGVPDGTPVAAYTYPPAAGFAGPSGVTPRSGANAEFETVEDRWRIGFPEWDRYGKGAPRVFDYPYRIGRVYDPFNQNVLKGDYPIYGQHTFFTFTGLTSTLFEGRSLPTATTPFESTARPNTLDFFGRPGQFVYSQLVSLSFDLKHGDASFKPDDWRVKLNPVLNINSLSVQELAVINPDVRKGTIRNRSFLALQEAFVEYKLADLSPQYDFLSIRAGNQQFNSDFRGFIFSDINKGVRLFGNYDGNRTQFNLAYFRQWEKDTNSQLNTFRDRDQNIFIANVFRQDFLFPGFTAEASVHFNNDNPDFLFDRNGFLARPDPVGVFQPHKVNAFYLGLAGEGHIGRYNVSSVFYWALGRDTRNPIAGTQQAISAQLATLELSYDRDWARFRLSGMYQSGDGNPNNGVATGFDGIIDQTNFGGEFSFFRRNRIPLFGVGLVNDQSNYVNLRSSRIQGQSNFVNPGLWLAGAGVDFDITPRFRIVNNANALLFDKTAVLETFTFQGDIDRFLGTDLSSGIEWRPRLNNNAIILVGASALIPGSGFRAIYNKRDERVDPLLSLFTEVIFQF
jgi:hypothetical protein